MTRFNYEPVTSKILKDECFIENLSFEFIEGTPISVAVIKEHNKYHSYKNHERIRVVAIYKCKKQEIITLL